MLRNDSCAAGCKSAGKPPQTKIPSSQFLWCRGIKLKTWTNKTKSKTCFFVIWLDSFKTLNLHQNKARVLGLKANYQTNRHVREQTNKLDCKQNLLCRVKSVIQAGSDAATAALKSERSCRAESLLLPCGSTKRPQKNTFTSQKTLWSCMFPDNYTHTHTHTHTRRDVGSDSVHSLMLCSVFVSEGNLPFHFSSAPSPSVSDLLSYHVDVLFPKTKTAVQANQNAALCSIFWDSWWQGCCIFSKMHSFMCSVLKEYFDILGNTFIHFLGDGWLIKSILFFKLLSVI